MRVKVAINGFGRIGRNILRALYENGYRDKIEVVAINDLGDAEINAHLLQFDSVHGRFGFSVSASTGKLYVDSQEITVVSEKEPQKLPWKALAVDVVLECTGRFTNAADANGHLLAGAGKVLISAPAEGVDAMIVYGVNDHLLRQSHRLVSNASCTTNCLAPVAKVLHEQIGIESGLMTTIHAYTNDQHLEDVYHKDMYRARAAALSMIPTKTGAAAAVGKVLPELEGRLDGQAVRVPLANVSLVDLSFIAERDTSAQEINQLMKAAASRSRILKYNDRKLVSIDFNHDPASAIFDANQTRVCGRQVKVMAWYDNEWGFSNRMLDTLLVMVSAPA
ncbi:MAG: type I glyceraldehyde-3-phosphate dehydrogenase [Hahellaceae bacterium]|nr:type I glyceraldehyde-3-phosphate dehydrogenase [Hahellaceae bacterium]MCP5168608.1 type I glyceraldehyde-3-phosphate dehydrogenase [Hahellaceae bacterium]